MIDTKIFCMGVLVLINCCLEEVGRGRRERAIPRKAGIIGRRDVPGSIMLAPVTLMYSLW